MNKSLITVAILAFVAFIGFFALIDIERIEGNEMGVRETWSDGVINEPLAPKTYYFFAPTNNIYHYDMTNQVFVMNDKPNSEEYGEGRKTDSYLVQSLEGQDMRISLNVQWARDPAHLIYLHKTVRNNIEEKLLRPEIMRKVKDAATTMSALDAYSGEGLVKLQQRISEKLTDPDGELRKKGVIVHNFVIEHIALDPNYVEQIKAKQVAVQGRLRAIEETKRAEADAEKAKAMAQADYETVVVQAKRDKEVGILAAEKAAQQQVLDAQAAAKRVELAAQAEKNRNVEIAMGEKEAGLLRAQAIVALGEAEAKATQLKLSAYASEGSEVYAKIQVAQSMASAFQNIKGYLPENMSINLLTDQFNKGVSLLVGGGDATVATTAPAGK